MSLVVEEGQEDDGTAPLRPPPRLGNKNTTTETKSTAGTEAATRHRLSSSRNGQQKGTMTGSRFLLACLSACLLSRSLFSSLLLSLFHFFHRFFFSFHHLSRWLSLTLSLSLAIQVRRSKDLNKDFHGGGRRHSTARQLCCWWPPFLLSALKEGREEEGWEKHGEEVWLLNGQQDAGKGARNVAGYRWDSG